GEILGVEPVLDADDDLVAALLQRRPGECVVGTEVAHHPESSIRRRDAEVRRLARFRRIVGLDAELEYRRRPAAGGSSSPHDSLPDELRGRPAWLQRDRAIARL